jgi:O-antigen/teichoic acid export membrane protein
MSLKTKAVKGVKWNTIGNIFNFTIQLLRIGVLTRILDKGDFGIVAIALMVIGFTQIFSDLGLTVAVIHKQNITDRQYSSVYWLNVITSILLYIILLLCAPLLTLFYQEPLLNKIIIILGIEIVVNGFGKMFQTIKTKEVDFKFISIVTIISGALGFVLTTILAIQNFGVFSLVYGHVFQCVLRQLIFLVNGTKTQKLYFHINIKEIKEFINIGGYRLGSQILDFISNKIDIFLIGRFFGMDNLGIYNLAKELVIKPYGIINVIITDVSSAIFSKIQTNIELLKEKYSQLLQILSSISFPIYIALFVFSDLIVTIIYGRNYIEVSHFVRILSIVGLSGALGSPATTLQVALGRTDIGFKWTIIRVIVFLSTILLASFFTIDAVAYTELVISIVFFVYYWKISINPLINLEFKDYIALFKKAAIISFSLGVFFFVILFYSSLSIFYKILFLVIYILTYALFQFLYNKKFIYQTIDLIRSK